MCIACIKYVCVPVMCHVWYRECKGEKICTDVKTVTSSQALKHRHAKGPGKAQWEALHNVDTVDTLWTQLS